MSVGPGRRRPSPEALLALGFFLVAAAVGQSGRLPDDEGYLTFMGAHLVARAPRAGIFFQKIHPSASALLAPFAAFGWRAFLVAHAAFAGLAVYLLGRAARRLTPHAPWAASLVLATSPMFLLSAATGQSNSTAVFFFAASLVRGHLERHPGIRMVTRELSLTALAEEVRNRRVVEEVIDFMELEPYRKALVGNLPYGVRKRVEVARALALSPKLLLLDEPMAGMTLEEKEDMVRFILEIRARGTTVVLIEHDLGVVMDISDRVYVLDFGQVIAEGRPEEVARNPRVQEAYMGVEV